MHVQSSLSLDKSVHEILKVNLILSDRVDLTQSGHVVKVEVFAMFWVLTKELDKIVDRQGLSLHQTVLDELIVSVKRSQNRVKHCVRDNFRLVPSAECFK